MLSGDREEKARMESETYLWSVFHPVFSGSAEMTLHLRPVELGRAGEGADDSADRPLQLARGLVERESSAHLKHRISVIH